MSVGGDAAEQMVRFYLEGFEVVAKISGKGAEHAIAILLNIMKDRKQTKGKARLNTMIKSGKPLTIFTINRKDLPKFAKEAKRYGVLYTALMKKLDKNEDGIVDIMVRQDDSSKVNRIVERFKLIAPNDAQIKTSVKKSLDEKNEGKFEIITKDGKVIEPSEKIAKQKLEIIDVPSYEEEIKNDIKKIGKKDNRENIKSEKDKADVITNKTPSIFDEKRKSVRDSILEIQIKEREPHESRGQKDGQRELNRISKAKDKMSILKSQDIDSRNFNQAKTEKSPLSEPHLQTSKVKDVNRKSVRAQLAEIQNKMDLESKTKSKQKSIATKGQSISKKTKSKKNTSRAR